uniref:Uncharacterized protein n=1 Tax=Cannabis sativa TaxID=3483 RepID=A0A803P5F9_CANSA
MTKRPTEDIQLVGQRFRTNEGTVWCRISVARRACLVDKVAKGVGGQKGYGGFIFPKRATQSLKRPYPPSDTERKAKKAKLAEARKRPPRGERDLRWAGTSAGEAIETEVFKKVVKAKLYLKKCHDREMLAMFSERTCQEVNYMAIKLNQFKAKNRTLASRVEEIKIQAEDFWRRAIEEVDQKVKVKSNHFVGRITKFRRQEIQKLQTMLFAAKTKMETLAKET